MCELPYRRAEPSHPLRQGGRNTGHGEGVKTAAAVESPARQVPSVAPHGMTPSCGGTAPCGWPKNIPAAPRNPIQREKPRPVALMLNDALDALDFPCVLASPSMPLSFTELPGEARWTPTPPDAPAVWGKVKGRAAPGTFPGSLAGLADLAATRSIALH